MKVKTGKEIMQSVMDAAKQRRELALRLRNSGLTVREVAERLGITKQRASKLLQRAELES